MHEDLLVRVRDLDHERLLALEYPDLDNALSAANQAVDDATDTIRGIKVASAGREPTGSQKRDYAAAEAIRTECADIANRLVRAVDQRNSRARNAASEAMQTGQVMWSGADQPENRNGVARFEPTPAPAIGGTRHTGGGHVYERGDHRSSWVKDMISARMYGDQGAFERLHRNNHEVDVEHRALNATDTSGGDFVPPAYLVEQWVRLARAGRVVADNIASQPLPVTDSINLPRITAGTATAEVTTQNTTLQQTDAVTDTITAAVTAIAGTQTLSLQLIEQSPVNTDEILMADLLADLATKVDTFVISNNGTNKKGILSVSGTNAITYTDASPTVGELYPKIADGIQQVHTGRYLPPTKIFLHPRRWAWMTAATDTAGRPLVVPVAQMPQNAVAAMGGVVSQGFVGQIQGLPAFVDPNIPTNLGAGTNEDRIIIMRAEDSILFESIPRAQVFPQPLAAQMSVLLRVYEYLALHAGRYPKSISIVSGTGLVTPTF